MKSLMTQILDAVRDGKDFLEVEDHNGKVVGKLHISPDLFDVADKHVGGIEKNKVIVKVREMAVAEEMAAVGDDVLEVDKVVALHGGLLGKIVEVSQGYLDRPYYKIFLQNADGVYGDPEDELNYGYYYARQLRDYGRGI